MIKSIKARWQAWLDGTTTSMLTEEREPLQIGPGTVGRPDPYAQLRPQVRVYEVHNPNTLAPSVSLATPKQRAYEAHLPQWAREALAEMDRVVGEVLRTEYTEVRTPQFVRRSRRNLAETMGDVALLEQDGGADELLARMTSRARRASDPDITGVIPTVGAGPATEEAWA